MSDVERQREHFNSIAKRYHDARRHPNHLCLKRALWSHVFEKARLEVPEDVRVLEPMCGYAEGHSILDQHLSGSIRYDGFDYSEAVVEYLRERDPSLNVSQADVTRFASERRYHVIILIGGLHHVPSHAEQVVQDMAELLEPGGYFVNLEPTHGNPLFGRIRGGIYERNPLFDEETERDFSVGELLSMFERSGLERRFVCYPGLLAYVLYYNPDAFPALNRGGVGTVKTLFGLERPFYGSFLARWLSFATLSIWRRPAISD